MRRFFTIVVKMVQAVAIELITFKPLLFAVFIYKHTEKTKPHLPRIY